MHIRYTVLALALGCAAGGAAQDLEGARIRAHVRFLASDLLEGRGVGARGGDLAAEYIATQFALAGLKPAGDHGTSFRRVPLVGVETETGSAQLCCRCGWQNRLFRWLTEFGRGEPHGSSPDNRLRCRSRLRRPRHRRPEFQWDDYKDADVRGKDARAVHQRAALRRPEVLRWPRPHLLRPLDLQVRGGAAQGRRWRSSSSTPRRPPVTAGMWCATPGAGRSRREARLR